MATRGSAIFHYSYALALPHIAPYIKILELLTKVMCVHGGVVGVYTVRNVFL